MLGVNTKCYKLWIILHHEEVKVATVKLDVKLEYVALAIRIPYVQRYV